MSIEERILLEKARNGDIESFELLIEGIKQKGYNLAFKYMKNEEDAKDAFQDSLIKVFRNLSNFNENSGFTTWVYRIIVNTCLDQIKKNKKHENVTPIYKNDEGEDLEVEIADTKLSPEFISLQNESRKTILECLNELSDKYREVIILRDIQGFSYEEITKIVDCSEGALKSRIKRARATLKEIYLEKMKLNE